ncbi:hypothetical protein [Microbacterium sp. CFBP9034]|uniref:hypothetical protein n=1 Tax=Microbacterium sp. CFBP9034 TaxID=3096540 RepID=UPI002A69D213|nr:hypothetical protein [Microbacterium sp. CFBP9034]MDY0909311.1 hypothetical protein [Microbacterium sp. CFBP9034]
MQIILAVIVGAAVGLAVHFLVADRATRGVVIGPVVGALSAGVVWTILTWAGVGTDSVWLWLSMFAAPLVVSYPVVVLLSRSRVARDANERARLRIG